MVARPRPVSNNITRPRHRFARPVLAFARPARPG